MRKRYAMLQVGSLYRALGEWYSLSVPTALEIGLWRSLQPSFIVETAYYEIDSMLLRA